MRSKGLVSTTGWSLVLVTLTASAAALSGMVATDLRGESVRAVFERKYRAWQEHCDQAHVRRSSNTNSYIDNEPYREMVELGIRAVPHMVEKVEKDRARGGGFLVHALSEVTKTKFHVRRSGAKPGEFRWTVEEFADLKDMRAPPPKWQLWLRWWREGVKQAPERFEKLHREWKALKQEGKKAAATDKFRKILDLGIVALPCIIEKVQAGDRELVAVVSHLTGGAVKADAEPAACVNWWEKNRGDWMIRPEPPASQPETETALKRLQSANADERKRGKAEILKIHGRLREGLTKGRKIGDVAEYRGLVDGLIAIVAKKRKKYEEYDEKLLAVQLLGEMRAVEAVDVLLDNIRFCPPQDIPERGLETGYPCVFALIRIGKPCTPGILKRLGRKPDDKIVLVLYAVIIRRVEGSKPGGALLKRELEKARTAQRNIGEMLKHLD